MHVPLCYVPVCHMAFWSCLLITQVSWNDLHKCATVFAYPAQGYFPAFMLLFSGLTFYISSGMCLMSLNLPIWQSPVESCSTQNDTQSLTDPMTCYHDLSSPGALGVCVSIKSQEAQCLLSRTCECDSTMVSHKHKHKHTGFFLICGFPWPVTQSKCNTNDINAPMNCINTPTFR